MRHRNSVKQLGRTHSHRKALYSNLVASLYINERIVTTKQKAKELKRISERYITRAKQNINLTDAEAGRKLHNKRLVMSAIKNREAVVKLFDDIAKRFVNRNGGYTRIYLMGRRPGDAAEMAIIELVEKSEKVKKAPKEVAEKSEKAKKVTKAKAEEKK